MDTQRFLLFLFAQAGPMSMSEAVELGALLGKSSSSLRGCASRLTRSGLLARIASGRNKTRYALSPAGKTLAHEIIQKFMQIHAIVEDRDSWDGTWTLVGFEIPETIRKKRDRLRAGLKQIGFGQLTSGIWIAARDKSSSVRSLASSLHIDGKVVISTTKDVRLGHASVSLHAHRIWPLAKLNRKYDAMKKKMKLRLKRVRKEIQAGRPPDARKAFLELFSVFSEAAELLSLDPCLPRELLPKNWLGLEVQDLIHEYFHIIHGLELDDPYAYFLRLPDGLDIPPVKHGTRSATS